MIDAFLTRENRNSFIGMYTYKHVCIALHLLL
jgi:hypothetical protein